jgi:hypothetical protein
MTTLALILKILQLAAGVAAPLLAGNPTGVAADAAAADLLAIVQAALSAHAQVKGQPIDLTLLQPIAPVA